jgi:hypothetical protein
MSVKDAEKEPPVKRIEEVLVHIDGRISYPIIMIMS